MSTPSASLPPGYTTEEREASGDSVSPFQRSPYARTGTSSLLSLVVVISSVLAVGLSPVHVNGENINARPGN